MVVERALSSTGLPDIHYALNPYLGCMHGCIYCYARLYTRDKRASLNWGKVVVVKVNITRVLEREVSRYEPREVGVGTITDPYQPVEAYYKLTRESIKILLGSGFPVSIQTKNPLVLRDLDILTTHKGRVDVGFTITSLDPHVSRFIEPGAPPPEARARALERLSSLGVKTWIFYGPIIPGLNDDQHTIDTIIQLARDTNSILYYDPLHAKPFMKTPDHPLYPHIKQESREWRRRIFEKITRRCKEKGVYCKPGFEYTGV